MQLPPSLEAKFTELLGRYPIKRSALIPMMLYAQDQFGFLSDEMLEEIAKRVGLNLIEVTETLAYYSMLRRNPKAAITSRSARIFPACCAAVTNSSSTFRSDWELAIKKSRRTELFRSKKSNASAPAPARPRFKSITIITRISIPRK